MMLFGDDTLLEGVQQRVRESALLRPAVMLSGRVSHDELPNYYSAADVFVSGSHSEGSDDVLIEAMSAGVVPVVSDIPSFRAIIGDCGAHFSAGDAGAFATALVRTCSDDLVSSKAAARRISIIAHLGRDRHARGGVCRSISLAGRSADVAAGIVRCRVTPSTE